MFKMCVVYNHYTNMYIEQSAVFLLAVQPLPWSPNNPQPHQHQPRPGQGLQLVDVPLSALLYEALHYSHQVRPSSDDDEVMRRRDKNGCIVLKSYSSWDCRLSVSLVTSPPYCPKCS